MAVFSLPRRRLVLGAAAACILRPSPSSAGSLGVNPIFLEFGPGRTTATLEVTNRGGAATAVQIRLFAWSQQGDEDRLAATSDLLASPPLFDIKADEDQVVRLMLRRPADRLERPYRLLLDEIPPAGQARQIVVALRVSIPVIVAGTAPARPELTWRAERGAGNQIILAARNAGQRHVRVNVLEATLPGARSPVTARAVGANPFVLPGAERRWRLDIPGGAPRGGGSLRLLAHASNAAPAQQTVTLPL
jgi:fimbrial chaperone protein